MHQVIVIGAGPAGLATSRELALRRIDHLVLERGSEVGHTWAHLYDSLTLHTARRLSALPGLPFPAGTPRFPTREGFHRYLCAYAEAFAVPVRADAEVTAVRRDGSGWAVATATGDELRAEAVVVATGIVAGPWEPDLPGRDAFPGTIRHSSTYRRPGDLANQRVLVVGTGNSSADIAVELAAAGAAVTVSVRSGATVLPRTLAGIPIQYFGFALAPLPLGVRRFIATAIGRLATLGRAPALPRAPIPGCTGVPMVGRHLPDAIRAGSVRVRGELVGFNAEGARFADGTSEPYDTVLLATGYRAAIGFLGDHARRDDCGFAVRSDGIRSADQPGLYFIGHNPDIRGGLHRIGLDARLVAEAIATGQSTG